MNRAVLGLILAALAALGCRAAEGSGPQRTAAQRPPVEPGLTLELTPQPEHAALLVEIRVAGPPTADVRELHATRAWADTRGAEAIEAIEVRDDLGEIPRGEARDEGADRVMPLSRPPSGELSLRYSVRSGGARLGLRVVRDRMTGVGHGFLLLPRIDAPAPTRIRWHLEALSGGARGASSFGVGNAVATIPSSALAHAVYAAGPVLQIGDEQQGLVSLGARSLDLDEVLAWSRRVRDLAAERFQQNSPAAGPFTVFLLAEPGLGNDHDGAYLDRALGLWFDGGRRFDAQLRIALAHELIHRHLGGAMEVIDDAGRPAAWFAEGFTVHYARRLLFDAGLIAAEDFIEDVERAQEEQGSGRAAEDREAYHRGSLYAARLDAKIRRASKGARSLDDLLRALRDRGPGPLRTGDFRAAVERELGEAGAADFDRLVVRGEAPVALTSDAFGPCFRRKTERRKVFDLGFEPTSLRGAPAVVRGVVKGSAAEKAGLREGALVILARRVPRPEDGPTAQVDLTVADRRGGKRIRYKAGAMRDIERWETRPCRRTSSTGR